MSTSSHEAGPRALSTDELATATGGASAPDAGKYTCPAGYSPNYTRIEGELRLTGPGGLEVPAGGGTYDHFTCDRLPGTPPPKPVGPPASPTALRPGGDR